MQWTHVSKRAFAPSWRRQRTFALGGIPRGKCRKGLHGKPYTTNTFLEKKGGRKQGNLRECGKYILCNIFPVNSAAQRYRRDFKWVHFCWVIFWRVNIWTPGAIAVRGGISTILRVGMWGRGGGGCGVPFYAMTPHTNAHAHTETHSHKTTQRRRTHPEGEEKSGPKQGDSGDMYTLLYFPFNSAFQR